MDDLDESWVVEAVTWTLYVAFLSLPVAAALYFELEPLVTVQRALPGLWGTAAAVAVGVGFLLGVRAVFGWIRGGRTAPPPPQAREEPPAPTPEPETPTPSSRRKRKRKKKKRKR